jgi:hypothetical protein
VEATNLQIVAQEPIVKRCACGASYTREEWGRLVYVGEQDDGEEVAELRVCERCDSTIAVFVGPSQDGAS